MANKTKTGIFLIIDETNSQNGITDRLKTAVGLYYIAKQNGLEFYFIHNAGFDIRDYLKPNKVNWSAELSDISSNPLKKRNLKYLPPFDHIPVLKHGVQYICKKYIGKNIIEMTGTDNWQKIWRDSYNELFRPADAVADELKKLDVPEHYTAVNARFINSLGAFETASYNSPLPEEQQRQLIDAVLQKVTECERESESPVIVSSDSIRFLNAAQERGFRTIDTEGIGHIMNKGIGEIVCLKTFVNFYLLMKADKIYSILNIEGVPPNSLYKTQYPRYAAILADIPFIRI